MTTLFLALTVAGCCVGFPVAFVRWLDGYSTVAVFRGAHGRSVRLTTPNSIDAPGKTIGVDIYEDGQRVERSGSVISAELRVVAKDFAVIWLDDCDVAVAFTRLAQERGIWHPIATYRFSTKELYTENDYLPHELARRVSAQFAREHPGVGPIKVIRREPSLFRE